MYDLLAKNGKRVIDLLVRLRLLTQFSLNEACEYRCDTKSDWEKTLKIKIEKRVQ